MYNTVSGWVGHSCECVFLLLLYLACMPNDRCDQSLSLLATLKGVRDAQVYARLSSFEEDWAGGRVAGWEDRGEGPSAGGAATIIDLEAFEAVEELETLGTPALALRQLPRPSRSVPASARPHAAAQVFTVSPTGAGSSVHHPTAPYCAQEAWQALHPLLAGS